MRNQDKWMKKKTKTESRIHLANLVVFYIQYYTETVLLHFIFSNKKKWNWTKMWNNSKKKNRNNKILPWYTYTVCSIMCIRDVLSVKLNFITINLNRAFDLGVQYTKNLIFVINFMCYYYEYNEKTKMGWKYWPASQSDIKVLYHSFQCLWLICFIICYCILLFFFILPSVVLIYLCFELASIPPSHLAFILFLTHLFLTLLPLLQQQCSHRVFFPHCFYNFTIQN